MKGIIALFFSVVVLVALYSCGYKSPAMGNNQQMGLAKDTVKDMVKDINALTKSRKIDSIFKVKIKREGFNGCVLIAQGGQVIYERALGFANYKTKEPLTLFSSFQLASTSKTFTAAAILQLYEQGKLSLNDNIQQYLPQFPYQGITIKTLLTHRSGLSNYVYDCEPFCEKPNLYEGKPFDNEAMLKILLEHKPKTYFPPNKKFEYCNTNYALLALVVEKVSGQKFNEYLQANIFNPLGMNHTYLFNSEPDSKNKTMGHHANGVITNDCFADDVCGDKGVYSTIEDMLKWDQALYTTKILKKETIDEAFTGYSNEHKGNKNYGLGWRIYEDKDTKVVFHNGWWHGYNSTFYRRLKDKTTIIVLSNKDNKSAYKINDILNVLSKFPSANSNDEIDL